MPVLKIVLDSRDRLEDQTADTTLCSWNISDMTRDIKNIEYISVYAVEFPNSMYNITSRNNTFSWELNGVIGDPERVVNIPEGHYTATQLIDTLTNEMNNIETLQSPPSGVTYNIELDTISYKVSFTPSAGTMKFLFDSSTLGVVLGFRKDSLNSSPITTDTILNLQGVSSVMLRSNVATQGRRAVRYSGPNDVQDFLCYVPISEPFLKMVYWYNNNEKDYIKMTGGLSQNIYIRVVNRKNEDISPNHFNYKVILLVDYNE